MEIKNKFSEANIMCSFVSLALFAHLSFKANPTSWALTHYVGQALWSQQACASMLSLKLQLCHLLLYNLSCLLILSLNVLDY